MKDMVSGQYYVLSVSRIAAIAAAGDIAPEVVARICLDQDWTEGTSHQKWLDTADTAEIADWVRGRIDDEIQARDE